MKRMQGTGVAVHSLLALEIALEMTSSSEPNPYIDTLPKHADFAATTPLMWPAQLQNLLPRPTQKIVTQQQTAINNDFKKILTKFPDLSKDVFTHSWLLVNSRTFNYEPSELQHVPDGQIAMVPIADLINHAEEGCTVTFSRTEYIITADRKYKQGEEIQFCYGTQHSNDGLLGEYGFILARNQWDMVSLDEIILPRLNAKQKADLGGQDRMGRFTLDFLGGLSGRTRKAIRLLSRGEGQEVGYESDDEERFNELVAEVLDAFADVVSKTLAKLEKLDKVGLASQRKILRRRWMQIGTIVEKARENLEDIGKPVIPSRPPWIE